MSADKLPTTCYKGVRDFPPEKKRVHDYILSTMEHACELFGFEKYDSSILEPTELYITKAAESEEIVNDQTYTFEDRGGRSVTLRPEMTPTVARMIAARTRELSYPVRWYSIPNCFRYERPQKGRLREFWQLNADIFGVEDLSAEIEIISLAAHLMRSFGAREEDFEIRLNDRAFLQNIFDALELPFDARQQSMKLLDKRAKMNARTFLTALSELLGTDNAKKLLEMLDTGEATERLEKLANALATLGIRNTVIDTGTVRGFNYYTGVVFEVFDTDPDNNRSLFGGGRYDDLAGLFTNQKIPGIGFGMGDVTIEAFLQSRNLIPHFSAKTTLLIGRLPDTDVMAGFSLAETLRAANISTEYQFLPKKPADHIKRATKNNIPYVLFLGSKEIAAARYTVKDLETGTEYHLTKEELISTLSRSSDIHKEAPAT